MRHVRLICLLFVCVMATNAATAGEQLIIELRAGVPQAVAVRDLHGSPIVAASAVAKRFEQSLSSAQTDALHALDRYIVVDIGNEDRESAMRRLLSRSDVKNVFPNHRYHIDAEALTNDSLASKQYALSVVNAKKAWTKATGRGIIVGVLDTGVDWMHEDLRRSLAVNAPEDLNSNGLFDARPKDQLVDGVGGDLDGIDNDGNGYVDDVIGFDFVDQESRNLGDDRERDAFPVDEQGHGTSVAGVIAATANNKIGVAGLAFDARVLVLRAFDATGNAEEDDIAAAIVYAVMRGARVINMSFGDGVDAPVLRDAVRFAASLGCTLIASAGNTGLITRQFPAGYDDVIAVGSTNAEDIRSPFSSTGSLLALTAPGEAIITTQAGGGYRTVSGTSFAAPYAAATAALLIEHMPSLSTDEIRSTLEEQSVDLGPKGWDVDYGAGRIDALRPLEAPSPALIRITNIRNEQEIDIQSNVTIDILGSAIATLFSEYAVYVGSGLEPTAWTKLGQGMQVRNGLLAQLNTSSLAEGVNTLRLVVTLQNGRTIEDRKRIQAVGSTPLSITDYEMVNAWNADIRVPVLTLRTNRPTACIVRYRPTGSTDSAAFTDVWSHARTHSFAIPNVRPGVEYEYITLCTADDGERISDTRTFVVEDIAARTQGWNTVDDQHFAGYVLNDVRDLYGDGKSSFVMNDIGSGSFGKMKTVSRETAAFVPRDTTSDVWIPRGMGDSNGDGIVEVFAHVVGEARLFQADVLNGNPFARTLFADSTSKRWNAAGMFDVDGDGKPELLMLSDSGCLVVTYRNGQYVRLGIAPNPTPPAPGSATNRVDEISIAGGDFDGDGNTEIAFGDTDGDLVISEFINGGFRTEFTDENTGNGGSGYIASIDLEGNGRPELVFGVPDSTQPNAERDYGRQLWTYKIFRGTGTDTYEVAWKDRIAGVRTGIGFRNGVGVGQLDGRAGDELAICAFTRLYVFSWADQPSSGQPIWYRPDVVSPRFLVYNFNNDRLNELGFGTTQTGEGFMSAFRFSQMDTTSSLRDVPRGLRARLTTDTTVLVSWSAISGAQKYFIYRSTETDPIFRRIDSTTSTVLPLQDIVPGSTHRYRVTALMSYSETPRSSIDSVTSARAGAAVSVTPTVQDSSVFVRGATFSIRYSEPLTSRFIEPVSYTLLLNGTFVAVASSAVLAGDSTVLIGFGSLVMTPGTYTLRCAPIRDNLDVPTKTTDLTVIVTSSEPPDEIVLTGIKVLNSNTVRVYFNHALVPTSATALENYVIRPTGRIASIEHDHDSITIHFDPSVPLGALGVTYYITVHDVVALDGAAMTLGAGNTLGFVFASSDVTDVFVYPHPVVLSRDAQITFANLTNEADVEILDQRFEVIARVRERDGNGGALWDLHDDRGVIVPPGLYFYRVFAPNTEHVSTESGLMKLLIKR